MFSLVNQIYFNWPCLFYDILSPGNQSWWKPSDSHSPPRHGCKSGILIVARRVLQIWQASDSTYSDIRVFVSKGLVWTPDLQRSSRSILCIPSGELTVCYGKSPFLMGISTISMAIFNSYLDITRGYSSVPAVASPRVAQLPLSERCISAARVTAPMIAGEAQKWPWERWWLIGAPYITGVFPGSNLWRHVVSTIFWAIEIGGISPEN